MSGTPKKTRIHTTKDFVASRCVVLSMDPSKLKPRPEMTKMLEEARYHMTGATPQVGNYLTRTIFNL